MLLVAPRVVSITAIVEFCSGAVRRWPVCDCCTMCTHDQAMMMVGEQFEGSDNDEICGAVVQNRAKGDRVAVWTSNAASGASVMRIG